MARKNLAAEIAALADELSKDQQTALATFMKAMVGVNNAESLADLADDVQPRKRKPKAKEAPELDDIDDDDDSDDSDDDDDSDDIDDDDDSDDSDDDDDDDDDGEDEEATLDEATRECIENFITVSMSNNSLEAVGGGVRELKPIVVSLGGDWDALVAGGEDRAAKAELAGLFIAANYEAIKLLRKFDEDDINTLAEELGIEPGRTKVATIKLCLQDINSGGEADEDEDGDDE